MCSIESACVSVMQCSARRSKYFRGGGLSNFPDENFREYVSENFDVDGDGMLSESEIEAVTQITAGGYSRIDYARDLSSGIIYHVYESRYHIKSLEGIEIFTNLQILDCSFNELESLDVSSFQHLRYLNCANNQLDSLDLSNNPELRILWCCRNPIASLDISGNPELQEVYCWDNELHELDTSNNENLTVLFCASNNLTALDLSRNQKLRSLSCGRNQIRALDLSNNPSLTELYCFRNRLGALDTSHNRELVRLSFTNNNLGTVRTGSNPKLKAFDCGENYLVSLDVRSNTALEELYFYKTTVKDIDLSANKALISLDCSNTNLMTIDLSNNSLLQNMRYFREKYIESLHLVSADGHYQTDMREYVGDKVSRVKSVQGYQYIYSNGERSGNDKKISTVYSSVSPVVSFGSIPKPPESPDQWDLEDYDYSEYLEYIKNLSMDTPYRTMPHYIVYQYDTGYTGSAETYYVPRTMYVGVSLPLNSFIYLPHNPETAGPGDLDEASKVVSIDEIGDFYRFTAPTISVVPINQESSDQKQQTPSEQVSQESPDHEQQTPSGQTSQESPDHEQQTPSEQTSQEHTTQNTSSSGSGGGGGCNSGLGIFGLMFSGFVLLRKKTGIFALAVVLSVSLCCSAQAGVKAADYVLPIDYTIYDISGTWTADFELTPELAEKIYSEWLNPAVSENKLSASASSPSIHLYSDAAVSGTWYVRPQDLYTLSAAGEYGGVILPVIEGNTSNDIYVALCTFSNDIQPGELISVHGFEADTSELESVTKEGRRYTAKFVVLDENYRRVDSVPESRKVYVAVSLSPEYINTGIVTVIRGEYITEEDPLYRLTPEAAQHIADQLGIASSDLKYLTRANIGRPVEPTDAMKKYVASDDHEIIINLPTVSVDEEGIYIIPITLSADVWEMLQSQDIKNYKFYALNDSELGKDQMRPVFINGLLNTWELFTLTGEKLDSFGVREFLMVGLLQAGKPFSLYLAKLIIMLLLGGCTTGIGLSFTGAVILSIIAAKLIRRK
ncbi:MAG: leucine-rich repeat domain-containing protein [Synergistaceae bacterium]|nr:leucine-rich repeat domain-containing protein [Synergistaceae bacterium]